MRRYKIKRGDRLWAIGCRLWIIIPIAYCLLSIACLNSLAEDKIIIDKTQPITITSNNMEARKKENLVIFKGDVKAEQKDYTLYSKELYVYYADGKEIKEMIATGDVRIVQLNKTATGEKAVYTRENRAVVLTGNPQVEQDCDVVKGDKITIFLDEDKSLVEGSADNRVKAVVNPKDEKTGTKCK
ncbi:MAG: lipopolysaccharide transport periplasmic protein LptA [Deltaproteobacteria bacterium]|nr:lipopolysaccharide transport periplasmic protein LptA [Deltaproteobacteria bacterium]